VTCGSCGREFPDGTAHTCTGVLVPTAPQPDLIVGQDGRGYIVIQNCTHPGLGDHDPCEVCPKIVLPPSKVAHLIAVLRKHVVLSGT
jgi:hypothetical protein